MMVSDGTVTLTTPEGQGKPGVGWTLSCSPSKSCAVEFQAVLQRTPKQRRRVLDGWAAGRWGFDALLEP